MSRICFILNGHMLKSSEIIIYTTDLKQISGKNDKPLHNSSIFWQQFSEIHLIKNDDESA